MKRMRGFTIIEFMIAMTLSLIVLAALTAAFVASSRSRTEIERANEQIENGRFALQILIDDLEMAGFYSTFDIDLALTAPTTPMTVPAAKPAPCTPANTAANLALLRAALPLHIQGYDGMAALTAELDICIDNYKPGTDIVLVRRTATCVDGEANCANVAGAAYFQSSLCESELATGVAANYYKLDTNAASLDRRRRGCAVAAARRQFLVHIYYIAATDENGQNVPTLMRAELGNSADPDGFTPVPLARGIEDLQIEYGIDADGTMVSGDGTPDVFTSDPDLANYNADGTVAATFADCAAHAAQCVQNWRNVVALRLNVLARNSTTSPDHVDDKIYYLGLNDDGTQRCARESGGVCIAFGDGYKRHVYQTSVRLNNPAGRRDK